MDLISVIVPIYNVEKYLSACLDSIISQTYTNLDIVLVNDGSTDACLKIAESYAYNDSRIRVFNKKNGGLSDARNYGLKKSKGDYIVFIDSDDLLSKEMFEKLIQYSKGEDADIVECDFLKFKYISEIEGISVDFNNCQSDYSAESALLALMEGELKQVVWNKLYKSEVIDGFLFEKNRINEDEFWTYKVFGNAKKIIKIPNKYYYYRQQAESIMGGVYNIKRLDGLDALEQRIYYMEKKFPKLTYLAIKTFCFASIYHYQQILKNIEVDPLKLNRNRIVQNVRNLDTRFFGNFSIKEIIWIKSFLVFPKTITWLRNILKIGI